MAISSETTLKKPKVVEESDSEDSEDSAESDAGQMDDELSAEDTMVKKEVKHEIKKEVEEEAFTDEYNNTEEGFVDGFVEVKDEEESDGESSSYEDDKTWKKTVNVVNETKEVNNESESSSDGLKDIDDNFGDDESEQVEESDEEEGKGSSGLANVMAKILASKKSDDVILSKAKTDKRTREKVKDEDNDTFEIVDGSGQVREVKKEPRVKTEEEDDQHPPSLHSRELQRKVWEQRFRVKPKVEEDREKERHLRVLATQTKKDNSFCKQETRKTSWGASPKVQDKTVKGLNIISDGLHDLGNELDGDAIPTTNTAPAVNVKDQEHAYSMTVPHVNVHSARVQLPSSSSTAPHHNSNRLSDTAIPVTPHHTITADQSTTAMQTTPHHTVAPNLSNTAQTSESGTAGQRKCWRTMKLTQGASYEAALEMEGEEHLRYKESKEIWMKIKNENKMVMEVLEQQSESLRESMQKLDKMFEKLG